MNCRRALLLGMLCLVSAPGRGEAGWPFTANGPRHGSEEYYQMRAGEPVGERARYHHGKVWPPAPRPDGPPAPLIHRFYESFYWPYRYTPLDQADVNYASDVQIANGWQSMCTFYSYHFDDATNKLNSAGLKHLQWLLSNAPSEQRRAYLASSPNTNVNNQRLSNMQESVAGLSGDANSLPISLRVSTQIGRPAGEIDSIFKQRLENMDSPIIPYASASSEE